MFVGDDDDDDDDEKKQLQRALYQSVEISDFDDAEKLLKQLKTLSKEGTFFV